MQHCTITQYNTANRGAQGMPVEVEQGVLTVVLMGRHTTAAPAPSAEGPFTKHERKLC